MSKIPDDYWSCCCVKRNRKGELVAIKFHAPDRRKCRKCGATRELYLEIERKQREESEHDA